MSDEGLLRKCGDMMREKKRGLGGGMLIAIREEWSERSLS